MSYYPRVASSIVTATTDAMTEHLLAWLTSGGQAVPADNLMPSTSNVVGLYDGTDGELVTSGVFTLATTVDGGKPRIGAPIYLAAFTDDVNTAAGKGTAIRPNIGKTETTPSSLAGTPPQNVVIVGYCTDNSAWDSTNNISIQLKLPAQPAPLPERDEQFFCNAYTGFSATKYLSVTGNTDLNFNTRTTWGMIWNHESPQVANEVVLGNYNGGFTNGFLAYASTQFRVSIYDGGGSYNALDATNAMNPGLHVAFFSNSDGYITLVHTILGAGPVFAPLTSITTKQLTGVAVPPDGSSVFSLGYGAGTEYLRGSIMAFVKLNYVMSTYDMANIASNLIAPPKGGDRFHFPLALRQSAAFEWNGDYATQIYSGNTGLPVETLTLHGGVTTKSFGEQLYKNIGRHMRNAGEITYDGLGIPHPDTMLAQIGFNAPATNPAIMITYQTPEVFNTDELEGGLWVDGSVYCEQQSNGTGNPISQWVTYSGTTATTHNLELVTGQIAQRYGMTSGVYLVNFQGPVNLTFTTPTLGQKRFVFVGADEATAVDAGVLVHQTEMLGSRLRVAYPSSGTGYFTCNAAMVRTLYAMVEQYGAGSVQPFADQIVADYNEGAPSSGAIGILLTYRDYQGNTYTPTNYAIKMGALVDAIHAKLPTVPIYIFKLSNSPGTTPNGGGFTLANYNTALAGLISGRAWLNVPSVDGPNTITWSIVSSCLGCFPDPEGIIALRDNIIAAMGSDF